MRKGPRNKPLLIRCNSHWKLYRDLYTTLRIVIAYFFSLFGLLSELVYWISWACRCSFQANENPIGHYETAYVWILSVARIYVFDWWFLLGVFCYFGFLFSCLVICLVDRFPLVCMFLHLLFSQGIGDSFKTKLHSNLRMVLKLYLAKIEFINERKTVENRNQNVRTIFNRKSRDKTSGMS